MSLSRFDCAHWGVMENLLHEDLRFGQEVCTPCFSFSQ